MMHPAIFIGGAMVWGLVWHACSHLAKVPTTDLDVLIRAGITTVVAFIITTTIAVGGAES